MPHPTGQQVRTHLRILGCGHHEAARRQAVGGGGAQRLRRVSTAGQRRRGAGSNHGARHGRAGQQRAEGQRPLFCCRSDGRLSGGLAACGRAERRQCSAIGRPPFEKQVQCRPNPCSSHLASSRLLSGSHVAGLSICRGNNINKRHLGREAGM